jgi:hypothetical protein
MVPLSVCKKERLQGNFVLGEGEQLLGSFTPEPPDSVVRLAHAIDPPTTNSCRQTNCCPQNANRGQSNANFTVFDNWSSNKLLSRLFDLRLPPSMHKHVSGLSLGYEG